MSSVICVLNKKSRDGLIMRHFADVGRLLDAQGARHTLIDLTDGDLDQNLAAALAAQPDTRAVVGLGGDGTHMAVLNALQHLERAGAAPNPPPFAVVPFGTGNDVAKSLGLRVGPRHLPETVNAILEGRVVRYDLGEWNDLVFADAMCVGLDAEILRVREDLMADMKGHPRLNAILRGYPLYGLAATRVTLAPPTWNVAVDVDGRPWYAGPLTNLVINNCRIHAGEFDVTPDARPNDGLLDAVLIPHLSMNAYRYAVGYRHLPDGVKKSAPTRWFRPQRIQGRHFVIRLGHPAPIQVDGEYFDSGAYIEVGIRPAAARFRVPDRCQWAA